MSQQRRRGLTATIWRIKQVTDTRGNTQSMADPASKFTVRCAIIPQRSARAEVVGEVQINVIRIIVDDKWYSDISLWGRVEVLGSTWDIVTPPEYHHGPRGVRHVSIDLRERPEL